MADQLKPLSDKLDINKIAEIKKKILSNRSNWEEMFLRQAKEMLTTGERGSRWMEMKENGAQLDRGMLKLTGSHICGPTFLTNFESFD